jgi:hypothetical protein
VIFISSASAAQIAGRCAGLLRWPGNMAGAMSGESVSSTTDCSGSSGRSLHSRDPV